MIVVTYVEGANINSGPMNVYDRFNLILGTFGASQTTPLQGRLWTTLYSLISVGHNNFLEPMLILIMRVNVGHIYI